MDRKQLLSFYRERNEDAEYKQFFYLFFLYEMDEIQVMVQEEKERVSRKYAETQNQRYVLWLEKLNECQRLIGAPVETA